MKQQQCTIPRTELRGITLQQLRQVCHEIKSRCLKEQWHRSFRENKAKTPLQPEQVNLYDLNANFILPQTQDAQCSYVELVASDPQPPSWFVSHWWGEPVLDFVACLEQHAFDRNLGECTSYWVCAYANNQHSLASEVGVSDLKQSSFFKALRLSQGVVSIVDKKSVVFTRIWCSFEISLALQGLRSDYENKQGIDGQERINESRENHEPISKDETHSCLYDVYTHSDQGGTVGLTDGVVAADMYPRHSDGTLNTDARTFESNYNGMRTIRQANFPTKVCEEALSICLETSQASVQIDRTRILNFIAGNENLNEEPPLTHERFTYINQLLRSKFATAAYHRCLEEGRNVEQIRKVLSEAPIEELQISFHGVRQFKGEAAFFTSSLPITLKRIDLKFTMQLFETSREFALGFGRLLHLESMKLNCSTSTLASCSDLWVEIEKLTMLQSLDLNFSYNQYLNSIDGLGKSIANLMSLEEVKLNFFYCSNVSSLQELATGLSSLLAKKTSSSTLQLLEMNFSSTGMTEDIILEFCESLNAFQTNISRIQFNFDPWFDVQAAKNIKELQHKISQHRCCNACAIA